MNKEVELLSPPVNFAVVQLPGRNYPGVVIQGDSLNILVNRIKSMSKLLSDGDTENLSEELKDVQEELCGVLCHYELICKNRNISLPY